MMNLMQEELARARIQERLEAGRAHRLASEARRARHDNRGVRKLSLRAALKWMGGRTAVARRRRLHA